MWSKNCLSKFLLFSICLLVAFKSIAQSQPEPKAKFSFNDKNDYEELSKTKIRSAGVSYCDDRFGNPNNAIYLYGNEYSFINLGNYPALKPKVGSISVWVKIDRDVWSGKGYKANPILLTKSRIEDDFFEAYGIYYELLSEKLTTSCARDSLRQTVIHSKNKFSFFDWHHIVITYDSSFFNLYIDGTLQNRAIKNFETQFLESDSVMIGNSSNAKNLRFMQGAIDDISFYDKVLSQKDVNTLYNSPNPNPYAVVFKWLFVVFAVAGVLWLFVWLIIKRYKLKLNKEHEKNKLDARMNALETKAIRTQMNPHFMFNSLNTLQRFLLERDFDNAHHYLTKFSRLLRKMLESSTAESIPLSEEISILDHYIELENLRSENSFAYTISNTVSNPENTFIPIMLIQPFVENAIWHGLMSKKGARRLQVSFDELDEKRLVCTVDDDGVGREESNKRKDPFKKKSLATEFIKQRLELIEKSVGIACSFEISDKKDASGQSLGTSIKIIIPKINPV